MTLSHVSVVGKMKRSFTCVVTLNLISVFANNPECCRFLTDM